MLPRLALAFLALALVSAAFVAQDEPQPRPRPGQGGPTIQGSMLLHQGHIFVLMGPTLYKVDPDKMEVVKELQIVKPPAPKKPSDD